jgi:hypothetical protein
LRLAALPGRRAQAARIEPASLACGGEGVGASGIRKPLKFGAGGPMASRQYFQFCAGCASKAVRFPSPRDRTDASSPRGGRYRENSGAGGEGGGSASSYRVCEARKVWRTGPALCVLLNHALYTTIRYSALPHTIQLAKKGGCRIYGLFLRLSSDRIMKAGSSNILRGSRFLLCLFAMCTVI